MPLIRNLTFAWFAAVALGACVTDSPTPEEMSAENGDVRPASYIRSAEDLQNHLQIANDPLDRQSAPAKQRVTEQLEDNTAVKQAEQIKIAPHCFAECFGDLDCFNSECGGHCVSLGPDHAVCRFTSNP